MIYRVAQKMAVFWYALTSSNINRFFKLFHCQNRLIFDEVKACQKKLPFLSATLYITNANARINILSNKHNSRLQGIYFICCSLISLPPQMAERLRRAQPVSVTNHVKARQSLIERALT